MANNSPRLDIEIGAITTELKKGLAEARAELKKFATDAKSTDYKTVLQQERLAQAQARTEATQYRTEIARLSLEKKKAQQNTDALSGSYREAQQRLTALGKSIREAQGGFTNTSPLIKNQIAQYNALNNQLKQFDAQMGNHQRNVGNYGNALSSLSPQLSMLASKGGGFLAVAAGVRSAYQAVSAFDSGMRNVEKTTGLTRNEVDDLGKEFVQLSRDLKTVGVNQLTEYATIAGQLGVKGTKDILAFTEALAKLETASNISGEEGGSEIARTLTLVDGGVQNVKAFADEIVNLGNNFAATEKEILANAESISQNVGIYRIGRQDVLAYATATKSVGIEAELVGSTFNRTLAIFESAIRTGNGLDSILKLIGGTQAQLSQRFKQDASGVLMDFIKALNGVYKSGGSVNEQLEKIGVDAVRDQRVIQSLAANGYDVLTRAMDTVRDASGALDKEFETAAGKMTNQVGRVKVAFDNLMISMEQGTGLIGNLSVAFASASADIIDSFNDIVTAKSFKEFFVRLGQMSSNSTLSTIFKAYGDMVKTVDNPTRGLTTYSDMKSFYKMTDSQKKAEIEAQKKLVDLQTKEFNLNKSNLKARDNMLWNMEKLAKMYSNVGAQAEKVIPAVGGKTPLLDGGDGKKKGSKNQTPISDILSDLSGVGMNTFDAKIAKINSEYDKLVSKIQQSSGGSADIAKALNLAQAKRDIDTLNVNVDRMLDGLKKAKGVTGANSVSLSGALTIPTTLTDKNPFKPKQVDFGDEFTKQFQSTLRRGLASTFDNFFSNIGDLTSKNFEIEKKYQEMRSNATASQIDGLNKMESLEKRINSGLSNMLSNIASTFTNIGGNMLSSALSSGISSGNFTDLRNMFSGKNKAVGYGALGSMAGSLLQGVTSKSSSLGQGLGGALAGAGTGAALGSIVPGIGTAIGAIGGAIIGGISGLLGAGKKRKEEELLELQLQEQKKLVALQERQAALAYTSSIVGQMTNQGIVTAVDRDAFGNLVTKINGKDIEIVLQRTQNGRG